MPVIPIEKKLIELAKTGNKSAFDTLMLRYQKKVINLVGRYVHDPSDALDVTQEVFIKVLKALPNFRQECTFYTWLYRITLNTAKNHAVAEGKRLLEEHIDMDIAEKRARFRETMTPERLLIGDELVEKIYTAIDALPQEMRVALLLREFEGKPYEDIAKEMDCPIGTIRSRIFRARASIFKAIQPLLLP